MLVNRAQKMHQSNQVRSNLYPQGIPLPDDEVKERKRIREWCYRVGYSGCSSPSHPLSMKPWEPPFTVLPHVWLCNADFTEFMKCLKSHGWVPAESFRWKPIRDYEPFEQCPLATAEEIKFWRDKVLPDPTSYLTFLEISSQENKANGSNGSARGKATHRGGFHNSDQSTCEIHGKSDEEPSQPVTLPIINNQQRCRVYNVVKRGKIIRKLKVPHGFVIRKVLPKRVPKITKMKINNYNIAIRNRSCSSTESTGQ